jgi:hypothetical protein
MRHLPKLLIAAALLFVAPVATNAERPDDSRISNQYSSSLVSDHRGSRHDRYDGYNRNRYRGHRGYYYSQPHSYYYGTPGYNYYYDYPQYYDYYYYPRGGSVHVGPLHFNWR